MFLSDLKLPNSQLIWTHFHLSVTAFYVVFLPSLRAAIDITPSAITALAVEVADGAVGWKPA